jgi:hypothetical protein
MRRRVGRPIVAAAAVGHVAGKSAARAAESQQAADAPPPEQAPEPAAPDASPAPIALDDQLAQIEQLAELHTKGILTDEEFAAKKQQILGI